MKSMCVLYIITCLFHVDFCFADELLFDGNAKKSPPIILEWDGVNISYSHSDPLLYHGRTLIGEWKPEKNNNSYIDCIINSLKTKCIKNDNYRIDDYPYGVNLKFKNPIAIFIESDAPDDSYDNEETDSEEEFKTDLKSISKLEQYKTLYYNRKDVLSNVNKYEILGMHTESHAYAPVHQAIGGEIYLKYWRLLLNKTPEKGMHCTDMYSACSVVVKAKWNGNETIAYCMIFNSEVGLGLPFNCTPVAYAKNGEWWILSYDSPLVCDGCGAGGDISCSFTTTKTKQEVARFFIDEVKRSKLNISLVVLPPKKRDVGVVLAGKNTAVNSKFFYGYYDKSYAVYKIYNDDELPNNFSIDGFFNLVISSEQSSDGKDYHDISNVSENGEVSDEIWFQRQVLAEIQSFIKDKLDENVTCEATSDMPR